MSEIIKIAKKSNGYAYVIRRKSDGLFSRGGHGPSWGKLPKIWTKGAFKNHLHLFGPKLYDMARSLEISEQYIWNHKTYTRRDFAVGLIDKRSFPDLDCEVLILDTSSEAHNMITIATHPAPQWIWEKVYRPHILGESYYIERIRGFCEKHGIDFDAPDTIEDVVRPMAPEGDWYHFEIGLRMDGAKHFPDEAAILKAFKEMTGAETISGHGMILRKK